MLYTSCLGSLTTIQKRLGFLPHAKPYQQRDSIEYLGLLCGAPPPSLAALPRGFASHSTISLMDGCSKGPISSCLKWVHCCAMHIRGVVGANDTTKGVAWLSKWSIPIVLPLCYMWMVCFAHVWDVCVSVCAHVCHMCVMCSLINYVF